MDPLVEEFTLDKQTLDVGGRSTCITRLEKRVMGTTSQQGQAPGTSIIILVERLQAHT